MQKGFPLLSLALWLQQYKLNLAKGIHNCKNPKIKQKKHPVFDLPLLTERCYTFILPFAREWRQVGALFPTSIGGFELRDEHQPKPNIVVVVIGIVVVAVRRAAILGIVVPATAPDHPVRTFQPASILHHICCLKPMVLACCVKAINGNICLENCVCVQLPASASVRLCFSSLPQHISFLLLTQNILND